MAFARSSTSMLTSRSIEYSGDFVPRALALQLEERLEAAVDQALAVERQVRHFRLEPRVGHHFCVDFVALRARLRDDPGKDDDLVVLCLHRARERGELAIWDIVADALDVSGRTVLLPDFTDLARESLVGFQILLRHGNDETIDVTHGGLLFFGRPKKDGKAATICQAAAPSYRRNRRHEGGPSANFQLYPRTQAAAWSGRPGDPRERTIGRPGLRSRARCPGWSP